MSERLQIVTSLVNHPSVTTLYKNQGSPTCDMNALIKLPHDREIWPIYVPSLCVVQLTYVSW